MYLLWHACHIDTSLLNTAVASKFKYCMWSIIGKKGRFCLTQKSQTFVFNLWTNSGSENTGSVDAANQRRCQSKPFCLLLASYFICAQTEESKILCIEQLPWFFLCVTVDLFGKHIPTAAVCTVLNLYEVGHNRVWWTQNICPSTLHRPTVKGSPKPPSLQIHTHIHTQSSKSCGWGQKESE